MRTFLADKYFVYRLLYCYQTDTLPCMNIREEDYMEYLRLLNLIKQELRNPLADSYNIILSVLYYLLLVINRQYAKVYGLPFDAPKNNYAFRFKDLLEQNICKIQKVGEYAKMMRISRITLNSSVTAQFGVSAAHLLKQRLLEAIKNEVLFSGLNVNQLADVFNFSDASHIMRFFKKQTGKTITQYRHDYLNGIYE